MLLNVLFILFYFRGEERFTSYFEEPKGKAVILLPRQEIVNYCFTAASCFKGVRASSSLTFNLINIIGV